MAKRGAPMGNKNAVGRHSGFGSGLAVGALGSPLASGIQGLYAGGVRKDQKWKTNNRVGNLLGNSISGAIIGGTAGGPVGMLAGATIKPALAVFSHHVGERAGNWASKPRKRK